MASTQLLHCVKHNLGSQTQSVLADICDVLQRELPWRDRQHAVKCEEGLQECKDYLRALQERLHNARPAKTPGIAPLQSSPNRIKRPTPQNNTDAPYQQDKISQLRRRYKVVRRERGGISASNHSSRRSTLTGDAATNATRIKGIDTGQLDRDTVTAIAAAAASAAASAAADAMQRAAWHAGGSWGPPVGAPGPATVEVQHAGKAVQVRGGGAAQVGIAKKGGDAANQRSAKRGRAGAHQGPSLDAVSAQHAVLDRGLQKGKAAKSRLIAVARSTVLGNSQRDLNCSVAANDTSQGNSTLPSSRQSQPKENTTGPLEGAPEGPQGPCSAETMPPLLKERFEVAAQLLKKPLKPKQSAENLPKDAQREPDSSSTPPPNTTPNTYQSLKSQLAQLKREAQMLKKLPAEATKGSHTNIAANQRAGGIRSYRLHSAAAKGPWGPPQGPTQGPASTERPHEATEWGYMSSALQRGSVMQDGSKQRETTVGMRQEAGQKVPRKVPQKVPVAFGTRVDALPAAPTGRVTKQPQYRMRTVSAAAPTATQQNQSTAAAAAFPQRIIEAPQRPKRSLYSHIQPAGQRQQVTASAQHNRMSATQSCYTQRDGTVQNASGVFGHRAPSQGPLQGPEESPEQEPLLMAVADRLQQAVLYVCGVPTSHLDLLSYSESEVPLNMPENLLQQLQQPLKQLQEAVSGSQNAQKQLQNGNMTGEDADVDSRVGFESQVVCSDPVKAMQKACKDAMHNVNGALKDVSMAALSTACREAIMQNREHMLRTHLATVMAPMQQQRAATGAPQGPSEGPSEGPSKGPLDTVQVGEQQQRCAESVAEPQSAQMEGNMQKTAAQPADRVENGATGAMIDSAAGSKRQGAAVAGEGKADAEEPTTADNAEMANEVQKRAEAGDACMQGVVHSIMQQECVAADAQEPAGVGALGGLAEEREHSTEATQAGAMVDTAAHAGSTEHTTTLQQAAPLVPSADERSALLSASAAVDNVSSNLNNTPCNVVKPTQGIRVLSAKVRVQGFAGNRVGENVRRDSGVQTDGRTDSGVQTDERTPFETNQQQLREGTEGECGGNVGEKLLLELLEAAEEAVLAHGGLHVDETLEAFLLASPTTHAPTNSEPSSYNTAHSGGVAFSQQQSWEGENRADMCGDGDQYAQQLQWQERNVAEICDGRVQYAAHETFTNQASPPAKHIGSWNRTPQRASYRAPEGPQGPLNSGYVSEQGSTEGSGHNQYGGMFQQQSAQMQERESYNNDANSASEGQDLAVPGRSAAAWEGSQQHVPASRAAGGMATPPMLERERAETAASAANVEQRAALPQYIKLTARSTTPTEDSNSAGDRNVTIGPLQGQMQSPLLHGQARGQMHGQVHGQMHGQMHEQMHGQMHEQMQREGFWVSTIDGEGFERGLGLSGGSGESARESGGSLRESGNSSARGSAESVSSESMEELIARRARLQELSAARRALVQQWNLTRNSLLMSSSESGMTSCVSSCASS